MNYFYFIDFIPQTTQKTRLKIIFDYKISELYQIIPHFILFCKKIIKHRFFKKKIVKKTSFFGVKLMKFFEKL